MSNLNESLQQLLEKSVADELAPGLYAVAFTRNGGLVAEAVAGVADLTKNSPAKLDDTVWFASTSKLTVSMLACLVAQDKNIDLDSAEQLAEIIPELKKGHEGSRVHEKWTGKGDDGTWQSEVALNDKITLRHLLTHTSGWGYFFNSEPHAWAFENLPDGQAWGTLGNMNLPRLAEAGKEWRYQNGCEWLTVFIARASGMSVRKALWKYLFEPIGVEPDTLDVFRTSPLEAKRVPFNYLLPTGEYIPSPVPFDTPQYEDDGPNGAVTSASAPLWGQMPAYAKVMQTLLDPEGPKDKRTGKPLFSKALWDDISCDNLARHYSLNIKQPGFAESANPGLAASIDWWQKPKNEGDDSSLGWSALQTLVIRNETETGLKPGTLTWCGLANTYYFIDRERGIGGIVTTQLFPWGTPQMLKVRDEFERWCGAHIASDSAP